MDENASERAMYACASHHHFRNNIEHQFHTILNHRTSIQKYMIQLLFGAKHTSNISTEMTQHIQILTNKQTTKSSKTTVSLSQNY